MISLTFILTIIVLIHLKLYFKSFKFGNVEVSSNIHEHTIWSLAVIVCHWNLALVVSVVKPTRSNDFSEVDSASEQVYLNRILPTWTTTPTAQAVISMTQKSKFRCSHMAPSWAYEKWGWSSSSNWLICFSVTRATVTDNSQLFFIIFLNYCNQKVRRNGIADIYRGLYVHSMITSSIQFPLITFTLIS